MAWMEEKGRGRGQMKIVGAYCIPFKIGYFTETSFITRTNNCAEKKSFHQWCYDTHGKERKKCVRSQNGITKTINNHAESSEYKLKKKRKAVRYEAYHSMQIKRKAISTDRESISPKITRYLWDNYGIADPIGASSIGASVT